MDRLGIGSLREIEGISLRRTDLRLTECWGLLGPKTTHVLPHSLLQRAEGNPVLTRLLLQLSCPSFPKGLPSACGSRAAWWRISWPLHIHTSSSTTMNEQNFRREVSKRKYQNSAVGLGEQEEWGEAGQRLGSGKTGGRFRGHRKSWQWRWWEEAEKVDEGKIEVPASQGIERAVS